MTADQIKASAIYPYNQGRTKHDLGQYAAAITYYNTAIRLKPDFSLAYNNRGLAKYHLGQYTAAITDYDKAIQLEPNFAGAYSNRGLAKYYLGQYDAATIDCDTAIHLEPNLAEAFHNRGFAKVELGQYDAAITDYDKAIQLEPNDAKTYFNRGLVKAKINQYDAAITDYDIAVRLEAKDAKIYYNRGNAKVKLGQIKEAITDYDNAIRIKPDYIEAYNNRGMAKYDTGQYDVAVTTQNIVIRLKPDYAPAYYNRGLAKEQLGQIKEAKQDWQIALKLATQTGNVELKNLIERVLRQYEDQVNTSDFATDPLQSAENKCKNGQTWKVEQVSEQEVRTLANEWIAKMIKQGIRELETKRDTVGVEFDEFDAEILKALKTDSEGELANEWKSEVIKLGIEELETKRDTEGVEFDKSDAKRLTTLQIVSQVSKQLELNFKPKQEKVIDHSEDQGITSEPQVKEKVVHYSEDQIKDIVADYFESLHTDSPGYSVKREYLIQMGSDQRRADVVFLRNGKLVTIAECKETGRVRKGIDQLKSYLCATDTFLGIFANDGDPNKWTFWENHRHNNFLEIDRETFENCVYNHDKTIKDRENKIKAEVQREIDAEIRERVRKNTDTDAVRQNETDRIKREITENIDRTAVVNSVKSQIAEQAKNGLLNKRDKDNRKLGRAQGFWWTIFGMVGIGILIAVLMSA